MNGKTKYHWYIYLIEYYQAIKKSADPYAIPWVNPKAIILSEKVSHQLPYDV